MAIESTNSIRFLDGAHDDSWQEREKGRKRYSELTSKFRGILFRLFRHSKTRPHLQMKICPMSVPRNSPDSTLVQQEQVIDSSRNSDRKL